MVAETIPNTRDAVREHTLRTLNEAIDWTTIESGPLEGLEVVSRGNLSAAFDAVTASPLPAAASDSAEVTTPASVLVWARCPRCGISQPIDVSIEPQLVVERTSSELRLKAKAKARGHACGQLPMQEGPRDDGQGDFDLDDIVGAADGDTDA